MTNEINLTLDEFREQFPESAKDTKLNLQAVLQSEILSPAQKWGVALACAGAIRASALRNTLLLEAKKEVDDLVVGDANAAASLMAMNNVFYRFRHLVHKPVYGDKHPKLRMNRIVKPLTNKGDFELFCLAVSAINACEDCIRSHEKSVLEHGMTEDHVHDAVRIASVINATAVAFELRGEE